MVSEKEKQKILKLIEMGKRAHMLAREGQMDDPELIALSSQLIRLDAEVNAHLGRRPPVRDGFCPKCASICWGAFCGGCGLNMDEYFEKPIYTCEICKYVVEAEDIFCGVCGSKRGA